MHVSVDAYIDASDGRSDKFPAKRVIFVSQGIWPLPSTPNNTSALQTKGREEEKPQQFSSSAHRGWSAAPGWRPTRHPARSPTPPEPAIGARTLSSRRKRRGLPARQHQHDGRRCKRHRLGRWTILSESTNGSAAPPLGSGSATGGGLGSGCCCCCCPRCRRRRRCLC